MKTILARVSLQLYMIERVCYITFIGFHVRSQQADLASPILTLWIDGLSTWFIVFIPCGTKHQKHENKFTNLII